ncbi:MAG TPA: hypothetical protein VN667_01435 [Burkholderiales bacterium]|nr:hypothetical protein [Burkholderiales bacterium]
MTPLSILGIGLYLPPSVDVLEIARAHGGDTTDYRGWPRTVHALEGDQPSTMGARALRQALEASGVPPNGLKLVIFSGLSRDYLPSWSVSTEVMKLCDVPGTCFGMDMTAGCVATLSALDFIQAWLQARGGGCAAVIAGERWSHTVDFSDVGMSGIWSYGDSGGALVVGMNVKQPAIMEFAGADFRTVPQNNGNVLIPYGGTRQPTAPPGVNPHLRTLAPRVKKEVTASYRQGYSAAYAAMRERGVDGKPERLLCNQSSPQIVAMLSELFGLPGLATGTRTGHLGGVDVMVGLQQLRDEGHLGAPVLVGSSTSYAFGTGMLLPPRK